LSQNPEHEDESVAEKHWSSGYYNGGTRVGLRIKKRHPVY